MDINALSATIVGYTPTTDSTFTYKISISNKGTTWELSKRYSDFDNFVSCLNYNRFGLIPSLPPKTLFGKPTDDENVKIRQKQLQEFLNRLLARPDLRTSHITLDFLSFDTRNCEPINILEISKAADTRFYVTSISYLEESNSILASFEDGSHLSKLGRVWTVVEQEDSGSIQIWNLENNSNFKNVENNSNFKNVLERNYQKKVRCACWHSETNQLFIGMDDGNVEICSSDIDNIRNLNLIQIFELHISTPIMYMFCSKNYILSIGYDTSFRVLDINIRDILCGGRLQKRIGEGIYLTCACIYEYLNIGIIATSSDQILILKINTNPPKFLTSIQVSGGGPIRCMSIIDDTLLIGHSVFVSCYKIQSEKCMLKCSIIDINIDIKCLSFCIKYNIMIIGHTDGTLSIWSMSDGSCLMARSDAHRGAITCITQIPQHNDQNEQISQNDDNSENEKINNSEESEYIYFITGGEDGIISLWSAPARNIHVWNPESLKKESIKKAEKAQNSDSSDDDDLYSAFAPADFS
eukprot:GHVL01010417.1.p1 GENE.GHVL01010417.1~~GHVL01010417.1.p1  ORF type:complete len:532 (+),score=113.03 GHVL01010417.1:25-1596(+)